MRRLIFLLALPLAAQFSFTSGIAPTGRIVIGGPGVPPSEFQDLYDFQLTRLNNYYTGTIVPSWDGVYRKPPCRAAELSPADAINVAQAGYYAAHVAPYLDNLQAMGIDCVKVQIGVPVLYRPYYDWLYNGPGCSVNCNSTHADSVWTAQTGFFQEMRTDLTARGMKLIAQSQVMGSAGSQLNNPALADYYDYAFTNDLTAYVNARADNAVNVVTYAAPDYINIMAEPEHEYSQVVGSGGTPLIPQLQATSANCATPGNVSTCVYEASVQTRMDTITAALEAIPLNHTTTKVAVGLALGTYDLANVIALEAAHANIDILDAHFHALTNTGANDVLVQMGAMASAAFTAGKGWGMDEESVDKSRPGACGGCTPPGIDPHEIGSQSPTVTYDRQWFGFWNPTTDPTTSVDAAFIRVMVTFCSWLAQAGTVHYYSYAQPNQFFNSLDYYNVPGCPPPSTTCTPGTYSSLSSQATTALVEAGIVSPLTNLGQYYKVTIAR